MGNGSFSASLTLSRFVGSNPDGLLGLRQVCSSGIQGQDFRGHDGESLHVDRNGLLRRRLGRNPMQRGRSSHGFSAPEAREEPRALHERYYFLFHRKLALLGSLDDHRNEANLGDDPRVSLGLETAHAARSRRQFASGTIPLGLGELPFLQGLSLSGNWLTGKFRSASRWTNW